MLLKLLQSFLQEKQSTFMIIEVMDFLKLVELLTPHALRHNRRISFVYNKLTLLTKLFYACLLAFL